MRTPIGNPQELRWPTAMEIPIGKSVHPKKNREPAAMGTPIGTHNNNDVTYRSTACTVA